MKRKKNKEHIFPSLFVEEYIKRKRFTLALEALCVKIGETENYVRLMLHCDPKATFEERSKFIKKIMRLLAFNYDVHSRPDPTLNNKLFGEEPLNYPPEWTSER